MNQLKSDADNASEMFNKVPEVTIYFWIIKLLATTVGETGADFLSGTLNLGVNITYYIVSVLLIVLLVLQFKHKRYIPWIYWLSVVFISIVGTLSSDKLADDFGVPLTITTAVFAIALVANFIGWYLKEKTLSIHTIYTLRREIFYWLAILFTFSLGTSAGDLLAEKLDLGYAISALVFAGLIGAVTLGYYVFRLDSVLSFWLAYIFTRPLGASLGDLLSQPVANGGLNLGTLGTSMLFLFTILSLVIFLTFKERQFMSENF